MDRLIRLADGKLVSLEVYQELYDLSGNMAAKFFTADELDCSGELEIAEPLLRLLDAFRELIKKPVKINSGYRTPAKQKALKAAGRQAATISPHCFGMAADVDAANKAQTIVYAKLLEETAKELGIKARFGFRQYLAKGDTFVHVDVCPEFYAKGKPLHKEQHPAVWENEIKW